MWPISYAIIPPQGPLLKLVNGLWLTGSALVYVPLALRFSIGDPDGIAEWTLGTCYSEDMSLSNSSPSVRNTD